MRQYWKEKLLLNEATLYDTLLSAFVSFEEHVICNNLAPDQIHKVYVSILNDHPELFQLPYNPMLRTVIGPFGKKTELMINNLFSRNEVKKFNSRLRSLYATFENELKSVTNYFDKERIICDYIISNTVYEIDNVYNQNAATVLLNNKGQCSGISKATKLLLDSVGIETIIVSGTASDVVKGSSGPHSWNIIKVNNDYYHLDVTFMLGANLTKVKPYNHLYFNYTDEQISRDHVWDSSVTPRCEISYKEVNEQEPNSQLLAVASLYELRILLKNKVMSNEHFFAFESHINISTEKLMDTVKKTCSEILLQTSNVKHISITIQNNIIKLMW